MAQDTPSAFAALRALRDELRTRLDRSEDYLAWKALDDALRQLDPPRMPKAPDFGVEFARELGAPSTREQGDGPRR